MTQEERFHNEQIWKLRMQEYRASGLTQLKWCEQEGIKLSSFRYWLRRLREEEMQEAAEWLKVCVSEQDSTTELVAERSICSSQAPTNMRIHTANITIELPLDTPIEYVSNLLRVVSQG